MAFRTVFTVALWPDSVIFVVFAVVVIVVAAFVIVVVVSAAIPIVDVIMHSPALTELLSH